MQGQVREETLIPMQKGKGDGMKLIGADTLIKTENATEEPQVPPKKKITFEDYERFLNKMERDGRMDVIEMKNPKVLDMMARE